jgi:hypothetical protein
MPSSLTWVTKYQWWASLRDIVAALQMFSYFFLFKADLPLLKRYRALENRVRSVTKLQKL